jgi:hypothetical protein
MNVMQKLTDVTYEDKYYGMYCHAELKAEEAEAKYIRLTELCGYQQGIIIDLSQELQRVKKGVCGADHTTITYILPPIIEPYEEDD